MKNLVKLNLPAFAFLDDHVSDAPAELNGRNVILHIRSASVVEIFDRDDVLLNDGTLYRRFIYENSFGVKERMLIALHYSATLDSEKDAAILKNDVIIPAAKWFCDYLNWEDENCTNE